jgi:hypothetical protein
MKKTRILIGAIVVLLIAVFVVVNRPRSNQPATDRHAASHSHVDRPANPARTKTVPAYYETAPSRASLGATLPPEKFTGLTREAYRAVREIPVTIAQLPCYCHCDRGMGHKSLYSCFEDDHAAHCAVCVNEALVALKLEKQEKLNAPQIRERIVAQFGHLND